MFTGIIEHTGIISEIQQDRDNLIFKIKSTLSGELKVDQSVAHNGVCLTVTGVQDTSYTVTVVHETVSRTNFSALKEGDMLNLERSMLLNGRLDGHLVQGHVDAIGICESVTDEKGSWRFRISYPENFHPLVVEKGSVCINGVSLTVATDGNGWLEVAIIPYTFEHTTFRQLMAGDIVNLEFDIVGKYVLKSLRGSGASAN